MTSTRKYGDHIYCQCGCVWRATSWTACPKCEAGEPVSEQAPLQDCAACGRAADQLINGECPDCHYGTGGVLQGGK